jgi:non-specific serine/threonine protein kinase
LGFIRKSKIDGKKIDNSEVTIAFSNSIQNDWFDIKMTVISDDFEFNFSDLIPNIKSQNPCFPYPTGIIFLIPLEWMTVRSHGKLAKINNGTIAVLKSNFAVLKKISTIKTNLTCKRNCSIPTFGVLKLRPYQIEGVQWLL